MRVSKNKNKKTKKKKEEEEEGGEEIFAHTSSRFVPLQTKTRKKPHVLNSFSQLYNTADGVIINAISTGVGGWGRKKKGGEV